MRIIEFPKSVKLWPKLVSKCFSIEQRIAFENGFAFNFCGTWFFMHQIHNFIMKTSLNLKSVTWSLHPMTHTDDSFPDQMQIFPGNAVFLISNDWNSDDNKIFWIIGKKLICPSALFKIFKDSMTSQSEFLRFSDFSSFWRSLANKSESLLGFSNWFFGYFSQSDDIYLWEPIRGQKSQFVNLPNRWAIFNQKSFIFIVISRSFLFCI